MLVAKMSVLRWMHGRTLRDIIRKNKRISLIPPIEDKIIAR